MRLGPRKDPASDSDMQQAEALADPYMVVDSEGDQDVSDAETLPIEDPAHTHTHTLTHSHTHTLTHSHTHTHHIHTHTPTRIAATYNVRAGFVGRSAVHEPTSSLTCVLAGKRNNRAT